VLFAEIRRRRGISRTGFEQIQNSIAHAQCDHVVSGFDLAFLIHGHTQTLGVEAAHLDELSGYERNVVETLVSEHPMILANSSLNPEKKGLYPGNFGVPLHERAPGMAQSHHRSRVVVALFL
jgi:hypothetical protein